MVDATATSLLNTLKVPTAVGLLLVCRYFDTEDLEAKGPDGKTVFTSIPYWASGKTARWPASSGSILVSGGNDGGLQDFLSATWGWDTLYKGAQGYLSMFKENGFPADLRPLAQKLQADQEHLRLRWAQFDDERLIASKTTGVKLRPVLEDLKVKMKTAAREKHAILDQAVDEALPHCLSWDRIARARSMRDAYLYTRSNHFGTSFVHNHFFTLLTIKLREKAGQKRHIHSKGDLSISYSGNSTYDPSSADDCASVAARTHFAIANVPSVNTILLRHGKRVTGLLEIPTVD